MPASGAVVRTWCSRTQLGIDHQAPRQLASSLETFSLELHGQPPGSHARLLEVQGHSYRHAMAQFSHTESVAKIVNQSSQVERVAQLAAEVSNGKAEQIAALDFSLP